MSANLYRIRRSKTNELDSNPLTYSSHRSGWSGNIKAYKGEPTHIKVDQHNTKVDSNSLAICKEMAKIDADKLAQREVSE